MIKNCEICKKDFYIKHSNDRRFCSSECRKIYFFEIKKEKMEDRTCKICGNIYTVLKTDKRKNCSKKCSDKSLTKEKTLKCLTCGVIFKSKKNRIFCSYQCKLDVNKEKYIKECKYCKKTFDYRKYHRDSYKKFCNMDCFNKWRSLKETREERGFSKEFLDNIKKRCLENIDKFIKNKTLEEIVGTERARELYEKKKERMRGHKNPMSLESISERENCSLEEAVFITPAKGRFGVLHPMYGKTHTLDTKIRIVNSLKKAHFGKFSIGRFDNIYWQGTWELQFIIDCIENGIKIKEYDLDPLEYIGEDLKKHHYFPDFIINEKTVVEIKGNEFRENTINKKNAGIEYFKENYVYINNINVPYKAGIFLKIVKEKYKERLHIIYNPYNKE